MPKFQKRHYEAIATVIADMSHEAAVPGVRMLFSSSETVDLARRLADYFAIDNPRFQRDRFLRACGVAE